TRPRSAPNIGRGPRRSQMHFVPPPFRVDRRVSSVGQRHFRPRSCLKLCMTGHSYGLRHAGWVCVNLEHFPIAAMVSYLNSDNRLAGIEGVKAPILKTPPSQFVTECVKVKRPLRSLDRTALISIGYVL